MAYFDDTTVSKLFRTMTAQMATTSSNQLDDLRRNLEADDSLLGAARTGDLLEEIDAELASRMIS